MPDFARYAIAIALATVLGWVIVGLWLCVIRKTVDNKGPRKPSFRMIDFWVGSIERSTAAALVIWAPSYLATFIGGWVVLKFAAYWQRLPVNADKEQADLIGIGSLVALLGSIISFSVAILAGLLVNPCALQVWQNAR